MMLRHGARALLVVALLGACNEDEPAAPATDQAEKPEPAKVGYDLRRLRPRKGEPLSEMFDRMREQAVADGKVVAVLFSADWCEPCRTLDLELGNMHPPDEIGHVRILELKEEDWEAATRMNEFNGLRRRWYAPLNSYPVFIVLDDEGQKLEEMKEAIERMESQGTAPTVPNWFRSYQPPLPSAQAG